MRDFLEFAWSLFVPILLVIGVLALVFVIPLYVLGDRAVKGIERDAPAWLQTQGFSVVGHEGFNYGLISQPGGCVWYLMHRKNDPTVYNGCVSRWHNGELQLYSLRGVNAIQGGKP